MDFINIATAIAKAGAVEAENAALRGSIIKFQRANAAALAVSDAKANERIAELEAVLNLFVKQWNACGPNSDFGRYFSNVRDAAKAALEVRS